MIRLRPALVTAALVVGLAAALYRIISPDPDRHEAVARELRDSHAWLSRSDETLSINAIVDLSLTMQPFVSSQYADLLNAIDTKLADRIRWFGFGTARRGGKQDIDPLDLKSLTDPGSYVRLNNDYAAVFDSLSEDGEYILIADGVQSDTNDTVQMLGRIVRALGGWLDKGGNLKVLIARLPYQGTYYPEGATCRETRRNYDCANRPLLIFLLARSERGLTDLQNALGSIGEFSAEVDMGQTLFLDPIRRGKDLPKTVRERMKRDGFPKSAFRFQHEHSVDGKHLIPFYNILQGTIDDNGYYPLTFRLNAGASGLSADDMYEMSRSLRPKAEVLGFQATDTSISLVSMPATVDEVSYRVYADSSGGSLAALYFVVPVRLPPHSKTDGVALRVTMRLSIAGAQFVVPADISTTDDCDPSNCPRTLNLQPLIGAIVREHYSFGRAILLADWPQQ